MSVLQRVLFGVVVVVGTGAAARAQTPAPAADGPAYAVAYVDVLVAARERMVAALRTYRDGSRTEPGFASLHVLEQVGWPGHFAVIEQWRDRASLDAHAAAAPARAFRDAMASIRVSGYDERPYKPLAVAPARDEDGQALFVVAHVDIGPGGQADAPALLRGLAEASRMEAGNLRFEVLQHAMRGNHFTVVGAWRSQRAVDDHAAAAHTRKYRETLQPVSGSPLDERLYRVVE
jgi:quinol monooxygenase YgiN